MRTLAKTFYKWYNFETYRSTLQFKEDTMGIATFTEQTQVMLEMSHKLRPLLQTGKLSEAAREVRILLDNSSEDVQYGLVKSVLALIEGKDELARQLMHTANTDGEPEELHHVYGHLLVNIAICMYLTGTHPQVATLALSEARHCLGSRDEEIEMINFIKILPLLADGKIDMACSLNRFMTRTWLDTETPTVLQWKQVLDVATLRVTGDERILYEITRSPVRTLRTTLLAHWLHRKFRFEAWVSRQPKLLHMSARLTSSLKKQ